MFSAGTCLVLPHLAGRGSPRRSVWPVDLDIDGQLVVDAVDYWVEVERQGHAGVLVEDGRDMALARVLVDQVNWRQQLREPS